MEEKKRKVVRRKCSICGITITGISELHADSGLRQHEVACRKKRERIEKRIKDRERKS